MKIRAFFALTLPDSVVRWLADHADTLCEYDKQVEVEWVDSDTYHLTLCFLGDITLEQVDQLEALARKRLEDFTSFQVHLNATDYYRVSKKLAIVAAMPDGGEEIMNLHELMEQVAEEAGIQQEDKGFKAHVTLGRLPGKKNGFKPPEEWPEVDLISLADSVVLFQSKPGERGSIYTPLFEIPLQDLA
ncbi:RNA 2',3'-cyclic phosphodiesterase [Pontibacterium granulatum]|uniref:RNA 2',3'-cyclic phosphodiesterase n=1 Tax=Pontibacterium granulatum TaxID=2036029 RepID=UPI00249B7991|nr:RNA 2',3'-cyclic phosphodiesterase [Pontibacterium granulatum]MDI3323249.1 RNA 2',3'-cyclic phosphodiesterase [Pontibacterium granulatum]